MRNALICCTLLIAATVTMTASPVNDPQILIDTGGDPLSVLTELYKAQPCSTPPSDPVCTYDFKNDTGGILTSFKFDTMIEPNLPKSVTDNFTCMDPAGFFLNCTPQYDKSGELTYFFNGVNPADGDEVNNVDSEIGEHEGIPVNGLFHFTFSGWKEDLVIDGHVVYQGTPTTTNEFQATPEPAAAGTLVAGLVILAAIWRRRRTVQ